MNIVITAGGVKEPIDKVRNITNSSSGKLGINIAIDFMKKLTDSNIFLIEGIESRKNNIIKIPKNFNGQLERIPIVSTNDLEEKVKDILTNNKIDIFIHSMAVADYTVNSVLDLSILKEQIIQHSHELSMLCNDMANSAFDELLKKCIISNEGKISSKSNNIAIKLEQTPKIINMIKKISPYTFLVGFKLLENVSDEKLFDVGFDLLRSNKCNLVLANDIKKIREGNHIGMLIYPEKSYDTFTGKESISENLVDITIKRYKAKHPHSIQESNNNTIDENIYKEMKDIGKQLYDNGFLPEVKNHDRTDKIGTYGNMSIRHNNMFYITCRNVHKGNLKNTDISKITKVHERKEDNIYTNVYYNSELKPSIDTSIHYYIYKETSYNAILHVHTDNVFLGIPYIDEQYPCGSEPEKDAILEKIKENDIVQMKKHGLVICGETLTECAKKLEELYTQVPYINKTSKDINLESQKHIEEVNATFVYEKGCIYNIVLNKQDVGIVWENEIKNKIEFGLFTNDCIRGKKLNIVKKYLSLYNKDYYLYTMPECNIAEFYKTKYHFVEYNIENSVKILKQIKKI